MLQYFEDDMVAREGALYGGKTHWPSALVLYIMEHVNPGLPEGFRMQWPSIVGSTPWLISWNHMSREELDWFYSEPLPTVPSDLEVAMEEVHDKECQDSARRTSSDQPIPPSRCRRNASGTTGHTVPGHRRGSAITHRRTNSISSVPDSNWTLITRSQTGTGQSDDLPVAQAQAGAQ